MKKISALAAVLGFALSVSPGFAQTPPTESTSAGPPPFPEFTFKRVKPPQPGQQKRITVQIRPQAAPIVSRAGAEPAVPPSSSAPLPHGWFWQAVGTQRDQASAGRLVSALAALQTAPTPVGVTRLQTLNDIAQRYGTTILIETVGTPVSPALVLAVIATESAGDSAAVSRAGAQGLMQLMPQTAAEYGVQDSFDPRDNIKGGVALLADLMRRYESDPVLVLAAYNAGAGSVRDHGGVPPFPETRDYVPKVLATWQVARGLCVTPPDLLSDGCVFVKGPGE